MQIMKMKLKTLVAAVALTVAAPYANAAIDLASTGNGELFFTAWDNVANVSYTRQLEVRLNDFLPNSLGGNATPESGLNLSFAGDALFASTFAGSSAGNIQWNVATADSLPNGAATAPNSLRILTTSTQSAPAALSLTNTGVNTAAQRVNTFQTSLNSNGCDVNASCATNDPASPAFGGSNSNWGASFGNTGNMQTAGTGFGSLFFYYVTGAGGSGI